MKTYKYIVSIVIITISCVFTIYGQSLKDKLPNDYGVTHHYINETKINLMKDANLAQSLIDDYKYNIKVGYIESGIGLGGLIFAGCFMDVPQWWSDSRHDSRAKKRRNLRYGIAAVSTAISIDGIFRIITNHKKLTKIQVTLQPTSGGIIFYY